MSPFFTIITSTYNAASSLPHLLSSLASQTCRDFELVLQDGASTDATVLLIEEWRLKLPHISLISEKDTGIYDAWNKALARARGTWYIFLGADDYLATSTILAEVMQKLHALPKTILFAAGDGHVVFADGSIHSIQKVYLEKSELFLRVGAPVCHPALFYNCQLFKHDSFDPRLRAAADYDFLCRHWHISKVYNLTMLVSCMIIGGISSKAGTRLLTLRETMPIAKKRFGSIPHELWVLYVKACLHDILQRILGEKRGNVVYDGLRCLNGKNIFWSKQ